MRVEVTEIINKIKSSMKRFFLGEAGLVKKPKIKPIVQEKEEGEVLVTILVMSAFVSFVFLTNSKETMGLEYIPVKMYHVGGDQVYWSYEFVEYSRINLVGYGNGNLVGYTVEGMDGEFFKLLTETSKKVAELTPEQKQLVRTLFIQKVLCFLVNTLVPWLCKTIFF